MTQYNDIADVEVWMMMIVTYDDEHTPSFNAHYNAYCDICKMLQIHQSAIKIPSLQNQNHFMRSGFFV
jgi:hypothetical protein